MDEWIIPEKEESEVRLMNPLVWAYIGDNVYELYIRTNLVNQTSLKVHELHVKAIQYVKAAAQARVLREIEEILTEEEKDIVRRTRNTKNHHIPKNADPADYMYATAFEGLIGYLFLTKQKTRMKSLIEKALIILKEK